MSLKYFHRTTLSENGQHRGKGGVKVQPLQLPKELAMDGKNLEKTTRSLSMRLSTQFAILQIALVFKNLGKETKIHGPIPPVYSSPFFSENSIGKQIKQQGEDHWQDPR